MVLTHTQLHPHPSSSKLFPSVVVEIVPFHFLLTARNCAPGKSNSGGGHAASTVKSASMAIEQLLEGKTVRGSTSRELIF